MASTTVENYLKQIYLGQQSLPDDVLLPLGEVAERLKVTSGTTTTMVKGLAEEGYADYRSRTGVRLTPKGVTLARQVLRRHRLVELFLVEVLGLSWTEVHEEAEELEHVVSDKVLEKISELLGNPETDPHGDPIPRAEGDPSLLPLSDEIQPETRTWKLDVCPLQKQMSIVRVLDQTASFLRYLDDNDLKPGATVFVSERHTSAEVMMLKKNCGAEIAMGLQAAKSIVVSEIS